MKEITSITSDGISYSDDEGNLQYIDFKSCHQNFLIDEEKTWGSDYTEDRKEFYQASKYVGIRLTFRVPPAIEFYTVPRTNLEFPTRERLYEVAYKIKKAGWRTRDGE